MVRAFTCNRRATNRAAARSSLSRPIALPARWDPISRPSTHAASFVLHAFPSCASLFRDAGLRRKLRLACEREHSEHDQHRERAERGFAIAWHHIDLLRLLVVEDSYWLIVARSEERRVGKE